MVERGDHYGYGICGGSHGEVWGYGSDGCGGRQQHVDHSDDAGTRGGSGRCGGD